jgi:hypothetical protein
MPKEEEVKFGERIADLVSENFYRDPLFGVVEKKHVLFFLVTRCYYLNILRVEFLKNRENNV